MQFDSLFSRKVIEIRKLIRKYAQDYLIIIKRIKQKRGKRNI